MRQEQWYHISHCIVTLVNIVQYLITGLMYRPDRNRALASLEQMACKRVPLLIETNNRQMAALGNLGNRCFASTNTRSQLLSCKWKR